MFLSIKKAVLVSFFCCIPASSMHSAASARSKKREEDCFELKRGEVSQIVRFTKSEQNVLDTITKMISSDLDNGKDPFDLAKTFSLKPRLCLAGQFPYYTQELEQHITFDMLKKRRCRIIYINFKRRVRVCYNINEGEITKKKNVEFFVSPYQNWDFIKAEELYLDQIEYVLSYNNIDIDRKKYPTLGQFLEEIEKKSKMEIMSIQIEVKNKEQELPKDTKCVRYGVKSRKKAPETRLTDENLFASMIDTHSDPESEETSSIALSHRKRVGVAHLPLKKLPQSSDEGSDSSDESDASISISSISTMQMGKDPLLPPFRDLGDRERHIPDSNPLITPTTSHDSDLPALIREDSSSLHRSRRKAREHKIDEGSWGPIWIVLGVGVGAFVLLCYFFSDEAPHELGDIENVN